MVEILRHDSRQHLRQEEGQHPGRLWVAKEIARHDGVVGDVEFAVLEAVLHDLDGVGPLGLVQHRQDQPGREGRVVSKEPVRVLAEDHLAGASPRRAHAVRAPFDEARLRQVRAREEDVVHARRRRQAAPQGRARELTVLVEEQEGQDRREPPNRRADHATANHCLLGAASLMLHIIVNARSTMSVGVKSLALLRLNRFGHLSASAA